MLFGAPGAVGTALGFTPVFIAKAFGPAVFLNQFIFTAILSPILIKLLYTYVIRAGLFRGKNVK